MDILKELDSAGAVILNRHFVYKSGKHGSGYVNADAIFPNVALVSDICADLVKPFLGQFDTVTAPAVGGIALAILAGKAASDAGHKVSTVWADKDGDDFIYERAGFIEQLAGKRVLVVEDLLTTGGSVLKTIQQAKKHGAQIVGVSVICNRGGVTAEQLDAPRLESLASVSFDAIDADACPLCADNVAIVENIGHGEKFKANNPDYKGGYERV